MSVAVQSQSMETPVFRSKVDRWLAVAMIGGAAFGILVVLFVVAVGVATAGPAALLTGLFLLPIAIVAA